MKTKTLLMVSIFASIAIIQGCASSPATKVVQAGTNHSILSRYADNPSYPPTMEADKLGGISLFRLVQLTGALYAGSAGGLSNAGSSLVIDESVASRRLEFGKFNALFAWLPASYGDSPVEVEKRFSEEVSNALVSVLADQGMTAALETPIVRSTDYGQRFYRVYGQICGDEGSPLCMIELTLSGQLIEKPKLVKAPSLLTGSSDQKVWAVTTRGGPRESHRSVAFFASPELGIDVAKIYEDLSRRLADDAFLYVARSKTYNVPIGKPGMIKGYYYVLNRGEELPFHRD